MDDETLPVRFESATNSGAFVTVDAATVSRVLRRPYTDASGTREACVVYSDRGSGHVLGSLDEVQDALEDARQAADERLTRTLP